MLWVVHFYFWIISFWTFGFYCFKVVCQNLVLWLTCVKHYVHLCVWCVLVSSCLEACFLLSLLTAESLSFAIFVIFYQPRSQITPKLLHIELSLDLIKPLISNLRGSWHFRTVNYLFCCSRQFWQSLTFCRTCIPKSCFWPFAHFDSQSDAVNIRPHLNCWYLFFFLQMKSHKVSLPSVFIKHN